MAGILNYNRPRLSPQNGNLETKSAPREAPETATETGYRRFKIPNHIKPITRGLMTTGAETFGDIRWFQAGKQPRKRVSGERENRGREKAATPVV